MDYDVYNFVIDYIKVYRNFMQILYRKKEEATKLYDAEMKGAVSQKSHSGNAKYQDKVCEYVVLEEYINSAFYPIKKAEKKIASDVVFILEKSIAEDKYIPCKLSVREFESMKMSFINKVAKNLLGKGMCILEKEIEGW